MIARCIPLLIFLAYGWAAPGYTLRSVSLPGDRGYRKLYRLFWRFYVYNGWREA